MQHTPRNTQHTINITLHATHNTLNLPSERERTCVARNAQFHASLHTHNTQHNTPHHTTPHNTTRHDTTQDRTRQHSTAQHSTTQHSTTQHNAHTSPRERDGTRAPRNTKFHSLSNTVPAARSTGTISQVSSHLNSPHTINVELILRDRATCSLTD